MRENADENVLISQSSNSAHPRIDAKLINCLSSVQLQYKFAENKIFQK